MNIAPRGKQAIQAVLNPHGQTPAKLNELMLAILGHAGCNTCGRMIRLDVEFGGDPGPDAGQMGVIAVTET